MSIFLTILFFVLVGAADVYCHNKIMDSGKYWRLNIGLKDKMKIPFFGSLFVYIYLRRHGHL